jgi:hypothetical protein
MSGHGIVGVCCFVKGWHKEAELAAVFSRWEIDILVSKYTNN